MRQCWVKALRQAMIPAMPRLASLLLVLSSVSLAQAPAPATRAEQLFRHARAMLAEKNYVDACPLLEQSHRLEPALGTLLNLADCFENIGRSASAYRAFTAAAEWAAKNGETKRKEVAQQRAQALEPKLSRVTIVLAEPVPGATAAVTTVDGAAVETWVIDARTVPLDAGAYRVTVFAPGRRSMQKGFEVSSTPAAVTVSFEALEREAPVIAQPPLPAVVIVAPVVAPKPSPVRRVSTAGVVTLTAGAVVLAASTAGLIWSGDVLTRVARQQPGGPDAAAPTVTRGEFNLAQPLQAASVAGAIVGGLAVVTGVTLLIVNANQSAPLEAGLSLSPTGAGVSLRGVF